MVDVKLSKIVIKYGGSQLYDESGTILPERFKLLAELIIRLCDTGISTYVVLGGGKPTRDIVQKFSRSLVNSKFGLNATQLDHISIEVTRIHSQLLRFMLSGKMETRFVTRYEELFDEVLPSTVTVAGGLFPGQSTNGTAALVSEAVEADLLVNFFGFDNIHSEDPTTNRKGKTLTSLSYEDLNKLISGFKQEPGHYELFDLLALNYVKRSKIPVLFLNGNNPLKLKEYLSGTKLGTLVKA